MFLEENLNEKHSIPQKHIKKRPRCFPQLNQPPFLAGDKRNVCLVVLLSFLIHSDWLQTPYLSSTRDGRPSPATVQNFLLIAPNRSHWETRKRRRWTPHNNYIEKQ